MSTFIDCFLLCKSVENLMNQKPANEIKRTFLFISRGVGLNHLFGAAGPSPPVRELRKAGGWPCYRVDSHPKEHETLLLEAHILLAAAPSIFLLDPGSEGLAWVEERQPHSQSLPSAFPGTVKYLPTSRPGFHPVISKAPGVIKVAC